MFDRTQRAAKSESGVGWREKNASLVSLFYILFIRSCAVETPVKLTELTKLSRASRVFLENSDISKKGQGLVDSDDISLG